MIELSAEHKERLKEIYDRIDNIYSSERGMLLIEKLIIEAMSISRLYGTVGNGNILFTDLNQTNKKQLASLKAHKGSRKQFELLFNDLRLHLKNGLLDFSK